MATGTETVGMADLTAIQRDLLYAIGGDAVYGLAIKRRVQERHGYISHSRLYPNLDTLVDRGLVDKRQRDGRTNEYELTVGGRELLEHDAERRGEVAGELGGGGRA